MAAIIVIDDDEMVCMTMKEQLEIEGFDVVAIQSANKLESVLNHGVKLIITDIIMPDKEGIEVIMELKKSALGIKIVAMSGGGTNDKDCYLNVAKMLGADGILSKPFSHEQLISTVKLLID